MKKLGLVLGAAAVVTLAGCKDPNFKRSRVASSDEVKKVAVEETEKPAQEIVAVEKEEQSAPKVVEKEAAPEVVAPPPAVEPETTPYVVQPGDSLSKISKKYNIKIASIKEFNSLKSDKILVGQKIKLPGKVEVGEQKVVSMRPAKSTKSFKKYEGATVKYTVKSGDHLGKIAYTHGISVRQLKEMNNISADLIRVGQKLNVPAKAVEKNSVKPVETAKPKVEEKKDVVNDKTPVVEATETTQEVSPVQPLDGNADVSTETVAPVATDSLYKTYQVRENESVNDIAASWGLVPGTIREINNLGEDGEVQAGQIIKLPASATQE